MPPGCLFSDLCPPRPSLPCPPTLPILSLLLAHGSHGISRAGSSKQLLRQELSLKDFFFFFLLPLKSSLYFVLRATEQVTDKTSGLVFSRDWVLGRDTHCSRSSKQHDDASPMSGSYLNENWNWDQQRDLEKWCRPRHSIIWVAIEMTEMCQSLFMSEHTREVK